MCFPCDSLHKSYLLQFEILKEKLKFNIVANEKMKMANMMEISNSTVNLGLACTPRIKNAVPLTLVCSMLFLGHFDALALLRENAFFKELLLHL